MQTTHSLLLLLTFLALSALAIPTAVDEYEYDMPKPPPSPTTVFYGTATHFLNMYGNSVTCDAVGKRPLTSMDAQVQLYRMASLGFSSMDLAFTTAIKIKTSTEETYIDGPLLDSAPVTLFGSTNDEIAVTVMYGGAQFKVEMPYYGYTFMIRRFGAMGKYLTFSVNGPWLLDLYKDPSMDCRGMIGDEVPAGPIPECEGGLDQPFKDFCRFDTYKTTVSGREWNLDYQTLYNKVLGIATGAPTLSPTGTPIRSAACQGDPHYFTLDGSLVTCNDLGWFLYANDTEFSIYTYHVPAAPGADAASVNATRIDFNTMMPGVNSVTITAADIGTTNTWNMGTPYQVDIDGDAVELSFLSTILRFQVFFDEFLNVLIFTARDLTGGVVVDNGAECGSVVDASTVPDQQPCLDQGLSGDLLAACNYDVNATSDNQFAEVAANFSAFVNDSIPTFMPTASPTNILK